jgi:hypothetical protein
MKNDINDLGLVPLDKAEMYEINAGGEWWKLLGKTAKKISVFFMDLAEASQDQYHMGMI